MGLAGEHEIDDLDRAQVLQDLGPHLGESLQVGQSVRFVHLGHLVEAGELVLHGGVAYGDLLPRHILLVRPGPGDGLGKDDVMRLRSLEHLAAGREPLVQIHATPVHAGRGSRRGRAAGGRSMVVHSLDLRLGIDGVGVLLE